MTHLQTILRAVLGVFLAILLLPVFVWIGLAAIGAAIVAGLIGTAVAA